MSSRVRELVRQVATFGMVGIAATAVHYFTAFGASQLIPLAYANPIGFLAAFGVSYLGHLRLTFRIPAQESNHRMRMIKFFAVALLGFFTGQAVLLALAATGRFPEWLTLLVAVGVVPVTTFVISRFWVFAQAPSDRTEL